MTHIMEGQKEVYARCCFTAPVCSYRIRSCCSRWLRCATDAETASFTTSEAEATDFFLLPFGDGRYKLQLSGPKGFKSWYLCCRGESVGCAERHPECSAEDVLFSLQLDENGRVSLRGGRENGYLSTYRHGCLWAGTSRPRKWEMFTLLEQAVEQVPEKAPWNVRAPVRVTIQTNTGKYLCAAKPVVTARAEAPCCCEEFLIDLNFSSVPSGMHGDSQLGKVSKSRGLSLRALLSRMAEEQRPPPCTQPVSTCTIRTADGTCLLSAEPDGNVFTTHVQHAQGRETFLIELHNDSTSPMISIQQATAERRYLSAEFGHLVNRRPQRRSCDYFNIQLANGSRVLIKSIHGGILGVDPGKSRKRPIDDKLDLQGISAWRLRSHGDSLYTLTSASPTKRGADLYMFVDTSGRIYQSSDPAVHFPAVSSLFEIKPVTRSDILPRCSGPGDIIGFTIRTARKIDGKQRYLSVEPNGSITAIKLSPSWWELFQLIDVDAAAAAAAPESFCCMPAAFNREPAASYGPVFPRMARLDYGRTASVEKSAKACDAAAIALIQGTAVPRKSGASLQELCITQVCCHASTDEELFDKSETFTTDDESFTTDDGFSELVSALCSLARRHELLPANIPSDLTMDGAFNIPDDLLARIWSACRLRQVPQNSCKWLPSAFIPQPQVPYARNRLGARGAHRVSNTEGWHCSSCDQGNVLPMDAAINPAHHKYLEFQSRVYSRAIQSTGILWNIISLAGVSIMSTALFCQIKAATGRRSTTSHVSS